MTIKGQSSGRTLLSPLFVISALLTIICALALRPALAVLAEHYRKESAPIRRPLQQFNVSRLPSFREAPAAATLQFMKSSLEAIGTTEKVYIDLQERKHSGAQGGAAFFVTYYSDPEDKVPHTPEVCYRQTNTVVQGLRTVTVDIPELGPESARVKVRLLRLVQPQSEAVIAYVFCANGEFLCDRQQVRWRIAKPGDKYVYFSKVEAIAHCRKGSDPVLAGERCKRLLREALPVLVEDHYPKREELKRR